MARNAKPGNAFVDEHGRIANAALMSSLRWKPGDIIAFTIADNQLIAATRSTPQTLAGRTSPERAINPRGHLNLPLIIRRRAGLAPLNRVLLAADDHAGILWNCPPTILSRILQTHVSLQPPTP